MCIQQENPSRGLTHYRAHCPSPGVPLLPAATGSRPSLALPVTSPEQRSRSCRASLPPRTLGGIQRNSPATWWPRWEMPTFQGPDRSLLSYSPVRLLGYPRAPQCSSSLSLCPQQHPTQCSARPSLRPLVRQANPTGLSSTHDPPPTWYPSWPDPAAPFQNTLNTAPARSPPKAF